MSENTAVIEETTVTETEETAPKVVVPELANITLPSDLPEDDATARAMLEKLFGLYNKVTDKVRDHRAHDKGDDAVTALLTDEAEYAKYPELAEAIDKLSRAKEAVKKFTAMAQALAAAIVAENTEDDFDADKSRAEIQALRKEGVELHKIILGVFEFSDKVTVTKDDTGKVEDVISEGPWGDALELASKFPNVRGTRGAVASVNSETAKIREWANENGHKVADRGRIPADVISAYEKANSGE